MPDFREFDDVVFIAGQNFQSEYGLHKAGEEVKEAKKFQNLQVLIDAKFIYPVAPDAGYNYLPPHLFKHINVRSEVMAKLEGAMTPYPDHFQDGKKPESMLLAEREARQKLTEMSGDTKEARKLQEEARKGAQEQYQNLQTVDANPATMDKGKDVTANYKGDKSAWELLEEQGDKTQEAKEAEAPRPEEAPVNLRKKDETKEEKVKDEENPDKAASKEPEEETKAVADPVGKQPSNVTPGGSKPASQTQAKADDKKTASKQTTAKKTTTKKD